MAYTQLLATFEILSVLIYEVLQGGCEIVAGGILGDSSTLIPLYRMMER